MTEKIETEEIDMDKKPNMFTAKVIQLGRVTIPDELRKLWNIEVDDFVELQILSVHRHEEMFQGVESLPKHREERDFGRRGEA